MKRFKKIAVCLSATAIMSAAITGFSTNAKDIGSIYLSVYAGQPSSANVIKQSWTFTTASSTTTMSITNYTKSGSDSYVSLISTTGIGGVLYRTGSINTTNVKLGVTASAQATLNDFSKGDHRASGKVTG